MPHYTLRTHPDYTLIVPEHPGKAYRNGDPIELSAERAHDIAFASKWHRFEAKPDEPTIGVDRHRSGRQPPTGVEIDQASANE